MRGPRPGGYACAVPYASPRQTERFRDLAARWLRAERRRLKRGAFLQFGRGRRDLRWLDREMAKCALPLAPGLIAAVAGASTPVALTLLALGAIVSIPWGGFVLWAVFGFAARLGDRQHALVWRKRLSREYQTIDGSPPRSRP